MQNTQNNDTMKTGSTKNGWIPADTAKMEQKTTGKDDSKTDNTKSAPAQKTGNTK